MLKVAITGGSGFIGSYLTKYLLKKKINLIQLSKKKDKKSKIQFLKFDLKKYKNFNFKKLKDVDILIHLAWIQCNNYHSPNHIEQLKFHKNFLNKIISSGVKNIVVSGSCFEYGKKEGVLNEKSSQIPSTNYGLAKLELLKYLKKKQKIKKFKLVWLRIFYIEGYFKKSNSIYNLLIKNIKRGVRFFKMSSGNQVRDYVKIEEIIKIIYKLFILQKNLGVVNLGSGKKKRLISYVNSWIKIKKSNIKVIRNYYKIPEYEPYKSWACIKKLNRSLKID